MACTWGGGNNPFGVIGNSLFVLGSIDEVQFIDEVHCWILLQLKCVTLVKNSLKVSFGTKSSPSNLQDIGINMRDTIRRKHNTRICLEIHNSSQDKIR